MQAIITPQHFADVYDGANWQWDRDTKILAQGLLTSVESTDFVVSFVVAKAALDPIKPLAAKLQKRDLDIYNAYCMIDDCIMELNYIRSNMETTFDEWFTEINNLANSIEVAAGAVVQR